MCCRQQLNTSWAYSRAVAGFDVDVTQKSVQPVENPLVLPMLIVASIIQTARKCNEVTIQAIVASHINDFCALDTVVVAHLYKPPSNSKKKQIVTG